ncbi:MAG TPA: chromosomal replication initiator protein DnaA [Candidatus Omnitrophota bacterium]|nr:chromosomal replication initiator protein DnaA [Candidatus Omnitrophota bacterium]
MSAPQTESSALVWDKVCACLKRELSERSFQTWFGPISISSLEGASVALAVPDSYYGKWLYEHYQNLIESSFQDVLGKKMTVSYLVVEKALIQEKGPSLQPASAASARIDGMNPNYTFDSFVIGPGNRFAHAAATAVSDAPAKNYNPLFVYGRAGLGKTHLLQSIANEVKNKNPRFNVLYMSSEKFVNQLITSIQTKKTGEFRARYRNCDLLLIDDIHFIADKEATQEEFFHTFNTLYDAHKQIVVSSDRPPKEIPGLEERLVSRFAWGLVTDIQPPDFETRVAILKKKIEKETVAVPDDVAYFIASKIKSNIRELEGALIRVVAYCTLTGAILDVKLAESVLKDSFHEESQKFSIEEVQKVVAEYFHIHVADLRSKTRTRSVVKPRQYAMFLIRDMTKYSLPEIGDFFGGRDHTTVLHACKTVTNERLKDPEIAKMLETLKNMLKKS